MFDSLKIIFDNTKMRKKLTVILTLQSLVIFAACLLAILLISNSYDKKLFDLSSDLAKITSINVDKKLEEINRLSFNILSDSKVQEYLHALNDETKPYEMYLLQQNLSSKILEYALYDNSILSINIIDTKGIEYYYGNQAIKLGNSRYDYVIRISSEAEGRNVWIGPDMYDISVINARQMRSYSNLSLDVLGTLVIRIDPKELLYNPENAIGNQASVAILMQDSVFSSDYSPSFLEEISNKLNVTLRYSILNINNSKYLVSPVVSEYSDWTFISIVPYEDVFNRIITMRNIFILICVIIFIFILFLGLRFISGITTPIEELLDRVKTIQSGDFKIKPLTNTRSLDEIGTLGKNFQIMADKIDNLINDNYVKELLIKESEIAALQAQINPHFLYNTLDSINWMAQLKGQNEIAVMTQSLGDLLRSSVKNDDPMITVKDDIEILNSYIYIQKNRYENRLDFQNTIDEDLYEYKIPKFTLQPIIENSIKYALEKHDGICKIRVYAVKSMEYYEIHIIDNGPGIPDDLLQKITKEKINTKGTGIGLKNIHDRIKVLLGPDYGLIANNEENGGVRIIIRLPYNVFAHDREE